MSEDLMSQLRYGCHLATLDAPLRDRFVHTPPSAATRRFVTASQARPHGKLSGFALQLLRALLSDYDAYGLLGLYPMFLLETQAWSQLLRNAPPRPRKLLDVGAGAGHLTAELAPLFDHVETTETSRVMAWRLRRRGLACHRLDLARDDLPGDPRFEVIACLNVLDRCAYPLSLLRRLRRWLTDDGRLLLAVPLPLRPHVHVGPETVDPEEPLPEHARDWESGLIVLVRQVLAPCGWQVEQVTRTPYLCRGDRGTPVRWLDDAVLVCSPGETVAAHQAP